MSVKYECNNTTKEKSSNIFLGVSYLNNELHQIYNYMPYFHITLPINKTETILGYQGVSKRKSVK